MRALTCELLEREFGCWVAAVLGDDQRIAEAIERDRPDLVVLDAGDFPACCRAALRRFPPERVIVVGPEPDRSYRDAALAGGAGAWIPRDRVGDDLAAEMRRVLGCIHSPCPSDPQDPALLPGPAAPGRAAAFR
jgi:DNA-binding NarL/FixJ family response regulator